MWSAGGEYSFCAWIPCDMPAPQLELCGNRHTTDYVGMMIPLNLRQLLTLAQTPIMAGQRCGETLVYLALASFEQE